MVPKDGDKVTTQEAVRILDAWILEAKQNSGMDSALLYSTVYGRGYVSISEWARAMRMTALRATLKMAERGE